MMYGTKMVLIFLASEHFTVMKSPEKGLIFIQAFEQELCPTALPSISSYITNKSIIYLLIF